MKNIIIPIVALLLSACASSYKPSAAVINYQNSFTKQQAMDILKKNLPESSSSLGICRTTGFGVDSKKIEPRVDETAITIKAWKRGEIVKTTGSGYTRRDYYKKIPITKEIKFADFGKVRIYDDPKTYRYLGGCSKATPNEKILIIHYSFSDTLSLAVRNSEFEKVIASILILSKQANIVMGAGL